VNGTSPNKALTLTARFSKVRAWAARFLTKLGSHTPSPGASTAYEESQGGPAQGRRECGTLGKRACKAHASCVGLEEERLDGFGMTKGKVLIVACE